jgi:3-carboxy-cis,cis-muconate cycloisomerase
MATDSTSASKDRARLSSSTSELFGGLYARGGAADQVSDSSWLQAMLDVEAALARACARAGEIPEAAAEAIARECRAERFDLPELARAAAEHASPVVPLARLLRERAGEHAHHGATSQDILDTAMMLVAKRALAPLLADLGAAAGAAATLAQTHRDTPVSARTLLQPALATSFGLKAAGWMGSLDEAGAWLRDVRDRALAVQMGGPVGHRAPAVAAYVAEDLGLAAPLLPWHANRLRPAGLASALGATAGALAKIARDVVLMAQAEVAEVREGGGDARGRSSAMAHKRNPVAAVSVLACTGRVPGLVATVLGGMAQEHERAAGSWQAEWGTFTDLLRLVGSAAAWGRDLLANLEVDEARMRANLTVGGDLGAASELIDRALAARRA